MANDPTFEFPLPSNSYAAFDAVSLRNLIIQRLNDQGILTDQNYIGSNLASIIDIISYAFNTLIYYLNKTSTESTFTEAQLYENIIRIVKLLDYKPIGYQTSTLAFQCSAQNTFPAGVHTIPRYSYVVFSGVPFSFNEDITFSIPTAGITTELNSITNKKLLYQGTYRENPIVTAAGDLNETVTINVTNASVDHFNIDVYVYEKKKQKWFQYKHINSFFTEQAFSRSFEKRLNSNFLYEITFGDGINGRRLEAGDRVVVYYLQSWQDGGVIGPRAAKTSTPTIFSTTNFVSVINDVNGDEYNYVTANLYNRLVFDNDTGSTLPRSEETVEEIRKNAPANFKGQYRLVTAEDFEAFVKTNFAAFISDVKVFSNWDYTGKYLKYFHDININPAGFNQILLNQVLYADACNFNNIYVCAVPRVSIGSTLKYLLPAQKEIISSTMAPVKTLTTEISFLDPIFKAVFFGVPTNNQIAVADTTYCQLEITRIPTNRRAAKNIEEEVANIFKRFFNLNEAKLGSTFDYTLLTSLILQVDGVGSILTRRLDTDEYVNGLSFFMWNPTYADLDKQLVTNNVPMRDFELIYFDSVDTVEARIVVKD